MLLSSNVALIGGNSTKPGSSYYALIKAVLSRYLQKAFKRRGCSSSGSLRMCRDAVDNKLNAIARASGLSSWSSKGRSNFFLQSLSLADLKGLGHLFMVTAASIRAA